MTAKMGPLALTYFSDVLRNNGITLGTSTTGNNNLVVELRLDFNQILSGKWLLDWGIQVADFLHFTDGGYTDRFSEVSLHFNHENHGGNYPWDSRVVAVTEPSPEKVLLTPYGWNQPYDGYGADLMPIGARVRATYRDVSIVYVKLIFGEESDINIDIRLPTSSDNWVVENRDGAARMNLTLFPVAKALPMLTPTVHEPPLWQRAVSFVVPCTFKRRVKSATANICPAAGVSRSFPPDPGKPAPESRKSLAEDS